MTTKERDSELEPLVTQCPNCETRFRVNEPQLQMAQGQVRCGACLTVFDATESLLVDGEQLEEGDQPDVDALLSEIDEEVERVLALESEGEPPGAAGSNEDGIATLDTAEIVEPDPEPDDPRASDPRAGDIDAQLEALEAELMAELRGDPAPKQVAITDEVLAEAPKPSETETAGESEGAESGPAAAPAESVTVHAATDAPVETAASTPPAGVAASTAPAADLPGAEPHPAARDVEPIPALYLEPEPPRRTWLTWSLLTLALLAIPVQILWYQFDTWAKDERLRPFYARVCEVAGCKLPVLRDVGRIVAKNSVLRDHPEIEDALLYDALLVNEARFAQPFPLVELTLTSLGGHLVASRRFRAQEYLGGEAASLEEMAPSTPIHISLAIRDPGEAPLNFKIRFLPAG